MLREKIVMLSIVNSKILLNLIILIIQNRKVNNVINITNQELKHKKKENHKNKLPKLKPIKLNK